ncbi:MAG: DUF2442 domain-containing protein [Desulfobacterales bacterium]|nr:DUF2442 domain-containing protein [Desulfobacterales bacterium]
MPWRTAGWLFFNTLPAILKTGWGRRRGRPPPGRGPPPHRPSAPLAWFPRLLHATPEQRSDWRVAGAGYGIHWPDIDEDLSTQGLLIGSPAPRGAGRAA